VLRRIHVASRRPGLSLAGPLLHGRLLEQQVVKSGACVVQVLHARYLLQLLHEARRVLRTFPTVMHASTLSAQRITVCGDLHGKLNDLLLIFWKVETPSLVLFRNDSYPHKRLVSLTYRTTPHNTASCVAKFMYILLSCFCCVLSHFNKAVMMRMRMMRMMMMMMMKLVAYYILIFEIYTATARR